MAADKKHSDPQEPLTRAQLEVIAALIDDRLEGHERAEAMRLLAESEEAYAVYAESVALIRETGDDEHHPAPGPASDEPPWYAAPLKGAGQLVAAARTSSVWKRTLPILAAAGIAAWLLLPSTSFSPGDLAGSFEPGILTVAFDADHPISASRGPSVVASEAGRAYRLGVRVMDAQAGIRTERRFETRATLETALGLLDDLQAPSPVVFSFEELRDGVGSLEEADADVETWLEPRPTQLSRYRFGKSSEAVRFATVAGERDLAVRAMRDGYFDPARESGLAQDALDSLDTFSELVATSDFNPSEQSRMLALLRSVMIEAAR